MKSREEAGALTAPEPAAADDAPTPASPESGAPESEAPEPGAPEPGAPESGAPESESLEPGSLESGSLEPGSLEPGALEPGAPESGSLESESLEPATAAEAGSPAMPGRAAGARGWTAALAALLAALLVGLVVGGVFLARVRHFDDLAGSRQAAVAGARTAVADLTTADYRQPQQYAARLRGDATGSFLRLFTNSATGFRAVLAQGIVQTAGHAAFVGVQQASPGRMRLAVLAYVTVKNSQAPSGAQRTYRLSVTMVLAGSRWLISNVEFVR